MLPHRGESEEEQKKVKKKKVSCNVLSFGTVCLVFIALI